MLGKISCLDWKSRERPNGKAVLGTRIVFKTKIGKDGGKIEEYKEGRFVAQRFRQVKARRSTSPHPGLDKVENLHGLRIDGPGGLGRRAGEVELPCLERRTCSRSSLSSFLFDTSSRGTS